MKSSLIQEFLWIHIQHLLTCTTTINYKKAVHVNRTHYTLLGWIFTMISVFDTFPSIRMRVEAKFGTRKCRWPDLHPALRHESSKYPLLPTMYLPCMDLLLGRIFDKPNSIWFYPVWSRYRFCFISVPDWNTDIAKQQPNQGDSRLVQENLRSRRGRPDPQENQRGVLRHAPYACGG